MRSLNGTGTTLYGKREVDPLDGSYIATEWVIVLLVPIIPLGSYRVWRGETNLVGSVRVGAETKYRMLKVNMNWRQVLNTYLIGAGILTLTVLCLNFFGFT